MKQAEQLLEFHPFRGEMREIIAAYLPDSQNNYRDTDFRPPPQFSNLAPAQNRDVENGVLETIFSQNTVFNIPEKIQPKNQPLLPHLSDKQVLIGLELKLQTIKNPSEKIKYIFDNIKGIMNGANLATWRWLVARIAPLLPLNKSREVQPSIKAEIVTRFKAFKDKDAYQYIPEKLLSYSNTFPIEIIT